MSVKFAFRSAGVFCVLAIAACSGAPTPGEGSSTELHPQEVVAAAVAGVVAVKTPTAADLADYVHAPGGVFTHKSCVHVIPVGGVVDEDQNVRDSDGNFIEQFPPCAYAPIITPQKATPQTSPSLTPGGGGQAPATNGWQSATIQFLPGSPATTWNLINANLVVPGTPEDTGAINFYFNGLEPNADSPILQPVLQWGNTACPGGNYWNMSAYRVFSNGTVNCTASHQVYTGDVLTFQIYLESVSGGTYTYYVVPYDNNENYHNTGGFAQTSSNGGDFFQLYFPAVHESYGDDACESGVNFYNITQYANLTSNPTHYSYVDPAPQQFVCDEGTSPSCFFCPQIAANKESTYVF